VTFSVIITCYERASELERVLAGLCAQRGSSHAIEVLLVDNNSEHASLEGLHRRYRDRLDVHLLLQPRLPHPFALSRARNLGLRIASGEWIISMDSDCIPDPDYVGSATEAIGLCGGGASVFTGERRFVDVGQLSAADIMDRPDLLRSLPAVRSHANYGLPRDRRHPRMTGLPAVPHPWDLMHGGNTIFRREDAVRVGGYDEQFDGHWGYEDIEFAHRLITGARCVPRYLAGIEVYHQEPSPTAPQPDRYDKAANPNWARVCRKIEGYREFKIAQNRSMGLDLRYDGRGSDTRRVSSISGDQGVDRA
jgi:glycosyltransferase involved in cell wall biosynthesis